jgi:hypothetical protein
MPGKIIPINKADRLCPEGLIVNEKGFVCTLPDGEQVSQPEYWIMSAASERGLEKLHALGMTPLGRAELGIF